MLRHFPSFNVPERESHVCSQRCVQPSSLYVSWYKICARLVDMYSHFRSAFAGRVILVIHLQTLKLSSTLTPSPRKTTLVTLHTSPLRVLSPLRIRLCWNGFSLLQRKTWEICMDIGMSVWSRLKIAAIEILFFRMLLNEQGLQVIFVFVSARV